MSFESFQQVIIAVQSVEDNSKNYLSYESLESFNTIGFIAKLNNISYETFKRFEKFNSNLCEIIEYKMKEDYKNIINSYNKLIRSNFDKEINGTLLKVDNFISSYENYLKYFIENNYSIKIPIIIITDKRNDSKNIISKYNKIFSSKECTINLDQNIIILIPNLLIKYREFNEFINKMRNFK